MHLQSATCSRSEVDFVTLVDVIIESSDLNIIERILRYVTVCRLGDMETKQEQINAVFWLNFCLLLKSIPKSIIMNVCVADAIHTLWSFIFIVIFLLKLMIWSFIKSNSIWWNFVLVSELSKHLRVNNWWYLICQSNHPAMFNLRNDNNNNNNKYVSQPNFFLLNYVESENDWV